MIYNFYVKLMQPKVGAQQTEGDDHETIHGVRNGLSGIWNHVDCSPSRHARRRPVPKRQSVLYLLEGERQGRPVWQLGRLPADGQRRRGSRYYPAGPPASLLPLTAPSQRMRRSLYDRIMRWTF